MNEESITIRFSTKWNVDTFFRSLVSSITLATVFLAIVFPAGSVYGINIKIIVSAALFFCGSFFFFRTKISAYHLTIPIFFLLFIFLYAGIALIHGVDHQHITSHSIAFLSLFAVTCLPIYFVQTGIVQSKTVLKSAILSISIVSIIKAFILFFLLSGIPLATLKSLVENVFGVSFIGLEEGSIYRINWPIDYIIPVLVFLAINNQEFGLKIRPLSKAIFIALAIFSLYLSYSRYLWIYGFASIFISLAIGKGARSSWRFLGVVALIVISALTLSTYSDIIIDRFFGASAASSDSTRASMLPALMDSFVQHPLFGQGLGSTTKRFVNIEELPWYFELQWLAFAMQFGVTGLLLLVFCAFRLVLGNLLPINTPTKAGLALLYVLWLGVGLVNGFMLTSAGASIFLVFYLASFESNRIKVKRNAIN